MKINKASESVTYARLLRSENGQAPRFLLRPEPDNENKEKDSVEISKMGRAKFFKKDALNRRLQGLSISEETLYIAKRLIKNEGSDSEVSRSRLEDIKVRIADGEYDFNEENKLSILAEIAMSYRP